MKVPILDGPKVSTRPVSTPYSNQNFDTGGRELAQGFRQLGAGMDQLAAGLQRAQEKANAIAANDAVTQYQNDTISTLDGNSSPSSLGEIQPGKWGLDLTKPEQAASPAGFMSTRGKVAAEKSAEALQWLEKRRKEISEGLANDSQRELFSRHSAQVWQGARSRIERHVSQQAREAEVASLKGRMATTLTAIANTYADDQLVTEQAEAVAGTLRAFALSPEDGEAQVGAWKQEVAKVRLNQFLAAKNWRGAETLFAQTKDQLGPAAAQFGKTIETLKQDQEAERTAMSLVDQSRDAATGRVDSAAALAALDKLPEGPGKDEVRQRLEHRVAVEERGWKQRIDGYYDRAFSAYLTGGLGAVEAPDKAWLIQNAPDMWDRLRTKARVDSEFERRAGERGARGPAETDEQREALVRFRAEIIENPDRYRDMTEAEFTAMWGDQLSNGGYKEAGKLFAAAKKDPKGSDREFTRFVNDEIRATPELRGKAHQKDADLFRAFMGDLRRDFIEQNKREPTLEDMEKFREQAWTTTVKKRFILPDTEVPAFQQERPKPSLPAAGPGSQAGSGGQSPAPATKVEVTDPSTGQRGLVPANKVDAWLSAHPGWKRR